MRRSLTAVICIIMMLMMLPGGAHAQTPVLAPDTAGAQWGVAAADKDITPFTTVTVSAEGATVLRIEKAFSSFKPWYYDTGAREKAVALRLPVYLSEPVRGGDTVHVNGAPYVVGALEAGQGITPLIFKPVKGGNTRNYDITFGEGNSETLVVQYVDLDSIKHFVSLSAEETDAQYIVRFAEDTSKLSFDAVLKNDSPGMTPVKLEGVQEDAYVLRAALQVYDNAGAPFAEGTVVHVEPQSGALDSAVVFGCDASGDLALDANGVMNISVIVLDDRGSASVDTRRYMSLKALRGAETASAGKWDVSVRADTGEPLFVKTLSVSVNALVRLNAPMLSIAQGTVLSLEQGESVTLKANYNKNPNIEEALIVWSSSNTSIASVTEEGVLTGLSPGISYIKATIKGTSAEAIITVTVSALNPPRVYTVINRNVNLREGPDSSSPVIAQLSRGDTVYVLSVRDDGWAKVQWADAPTGYAYISVRYILEN